MGYFSSSLLAGSASRPLHSVIRGLLVTGIVMSPISAAAVTPDEYLARPELLKKAACNGADAVRLDKVFFVICYDKKWKIPRWVAYHLTARDLEGDVDRTEDFRIDPVLKRREQASLSDYKGKGYHRGHMAPAEAFDRSLVTMSTTFLLTNMAPQTPSLNSGKWRSLEARVLKVITAHRGAWVFTGNLFAKEKRRKRRPVIYTSLTKSRKTIGAGRVAVPTHSFKAILVARSGGTLSAYGFIMPNQPKRLSGKVRDYQRSVREIEQLTGADFFCRAGGPTGKPSGNGRCGMAAQTLSDTMNVNCERDEVICRNPIGQRSF